MIKINLLPVELRPRKKTLLPVRQMTLAGAVILAVFILIYLSVGIKIVRENRKLASLKKEYEDLKPEYDRVKKLKVDKERLETRIAIMDKLLSQRFLWAKKLNEFSDLMSPQVWLSTLAVTAGTSTRLVEGKEVKTATQLLLIRGKTYSNKGEKMVEQVGDFIRRLEQNEPFFKDFVNVELVSTERESIGEAEVMRFELFCQFK